MTESELLTAAAGYIERGWVQGTFATLANGGRCRPRASDACAWCAVGAISAACEDSVSASLHAAARARLFRLSGDTYSLANWNDTPGRTQAEVLDLFRRAAAEAAAEGK